MKRKTIGLINLDSGVYMFNETLRYISWKLRKAKYKVLKLECGNYLKACTCFNALNEEDIERIGRNKVCCPENRVESDLNFIIGEIPYSPETRIFTNLFWENFNKNNKIIDVIDIEYKSFQIAKFAFFDFSIKEKIRIENVLDENLKKKFFHGILDQIVLINYLEEFSKTFFPDKIIYINGNYSQNTLIRNFFAKKGIKSLSIENQPTSQSTLNRISIISDRAVLEPEFLFKKMTTKESQEKISILDTFKTLKNFGGRITGNDFNAYTSLSLDLKTKNDIKNLNHFSSKYSIIHSYFLSSEDEIISHEYTHGLGENKLENRILDFPFVSQEKFTEYFINEANNYPKIGFIVRLHPRMAKNKRNYSESAEHIRYKKLFSKLKIPENIHIIYGDSKISSYYIIIISNLVITTWSTIGLETLLLGKKAIALFPYKTCYPIASFSVQPNNWKDLKEAIFKQTKFGICNDISLISWVQNAYHSQFFLTPVPRGKGGLIGKLYGKIYKAFSKLGLYNYLAQTLDILNWKTLKFDQNYLLKKYERNYKFNKFKKSILKLIINNYRIKFNKLLLTYGDK